MSTTFDFVESPEQEEHTGCFLLTVPCGILGKAELLQALAIGGQFPTYFGANWDALLDCLRDFSWIQEKRIVISHCDMPLRIASEDCRTYLEILRDAVSHWKRNANELGLNDKGFCEHELRVLFPVFERPSVVNVLA